MTNIEGLELLFYALGLFVVCLVISGVLGGVWWARGRVGTRVVRLVALSGIVASLISWAFALWFVSPAGMIERLVRPNPVLFALLIGYSLPGMLGGYVFGVLSVRA